MLDNRDDWISALIRPIRQRAFCLYMALRWLILIWPSFQEVFIDFYSEADNAYNWP